MLLRIDWNSAYIQLIFYLKPVAVFSVCAKRGVV